MSSRFPDAVTREFYLEIFRGVTRELRERRDSSERRT